MKKFILFVALTFLFHFAKSQSAGPGCNPHFTFTQNGLQLDFHAVVQNAGWGYAWSFGDSNTGNGPNPTHTYASAGTYIVCLTVFDTANSCSDTYCDTIGVWLGVKENIFSSSLKIFPNPASQNATLSYFLPSSSTTQIEIFDLTGRCVKIITDQMENSGEHQLQFSLADLAPGSYLVHVSANAGTCVMRLEKE